MCLQIIYLIYTYKQDLALNNLQWLIPLLNDFKNVLNSKSSKRHVFVFYRSEKRN